MVSSTIEINTAINTKKKHSISRLKNATTPYVFVLPWLILFLSFTAYPLILSFYTSLTDFNPLDPTSINKFVGFTNYLELLKDKNFHTSLLNTLYFTVCTIPITTILAMLLAVALTQGIKLNTLFQVGFFFPTVTSMSVISLLWVLLLYKDGIISRVCILFGLEPRNWLLDKDTALPSIMAMCIWSAIGFYMLIYISALQSIPKELYEAAIVDGASSWQKFFFVTLPFLRHTTIYVIVLNTINSLQIFSEPQIMTKGGPAYYSTTAVLYLYRQGFTGHRMGYASAVGYVLFAIILVFALIQMKILKLDKGVDD